MEHADTARWSLEFLLRQSSVPTNLLTRLLSNIPISNVDSRLKKTLLLRTLHDHVSEVSITEPVLDTLENLEELLRCDGSPITTAMSAAYCAVAVECTLKHLDLHNNNNNCDYLDAVNRVWGARVCYMNASDDSEGSLMFSPELERWKSDIEASVSDSRVRERLASVDSRRDAIAKLRVFLDEAWAQLGPSFLRMAANIALTRKHSEAQHQEKVTQVCGSAAAAGKEHLSRAVEVQKDGERGSLELQTSIKDLNSLKVNEEVLVENQVIDADGPFIDVPFLDDIHNDEADVKEKDQTSLPQNPGKMPSLMEKNSTVCTYEWDDSVDGLQDGTSSNRDRFHLPSPKRRKLSPLKKYDYASGSTTLRRPKKKWSQLEEETLRTAVDKFGRGHWKLILDAHKDIFDERTEVDLKDKWRNMTRYRGN